MFKMRKLVTIILAILILISATIGCADNNVTNETRDTSESIEAQALRLTADQLASHVRLGDFEDADFIFAPPLHNVQQTQHLLWEINFDPHDKDRDCLSYYIAVYLDADLTMYAYPRLRFDSELGVISIAPPSRPLPFQIRYSPYENYYWGYNEKYFMVRYYNVDGEKLDKPIVTVFTVENELQAPFVKFSVEEGFATFRWQPIPGAEIYHVYRMNRVRVEGGLYYIARLLWKTEDTEFTYDDVYVRDGSGQTIRNRSLNICECCVEGLVDYVIIVTALGDGRHSSFSNKIHSSDIAPLLPFMVANVGYDTDAVRAAPYVDELSVFRWIEMADGSLVRMPITHHIDQREIYCASLLFPTAMDPGELLGMRIPVTVQGIEMEDFAAVRNFDYPEFEEDLQRLKEREIVDPRAGMLTPSIERATGDEVIPDEPAHLYVGEFRVNASNPLSEFLAINMINGAEHVDLRAFPEASNSEFLIAAWQEAVHQNPMVLKVRGISWNIFGDLFIEYGQTREEQQRQQAAIMAEVRRIVDEIITDDMTDLEKQLAINNYLVENATYDFAALEYAEQYDFLHVDSRFYPSFTAYGVLINGVGVCSSYAYAFRLLADEAGLRNVVVTGHMFGTLPHAWNRVYIDGEWLTLDVTNNDDDYMRNIFFNLPDHVAETVLMEDNRFSMSGINYASRTYDMEYYRLAGMFYYPTEIVAAIIRDLNDKGYAMLRTDYALTEDEFLEIVSDVVAMGGFNIRDMTGGMMLGVIYLSVEG